MLAKIDIGVLGKTMLDAAHAARIGVTLTIIDSGRPRNVYISEAAADILGWSVDELLERDPMQSIASEDLSRMNERLKSRIDGEFGQNRSELVTVRKDGQRVLLEVTASTVTVDGSLAVFAFLVDVSARRAAEQERLRNEARFRELIESAPEPIGIIRGGHFVYANPAYVAALGHSNAQSLYETPIASVLAPEEAALRDVRESAILERGLRTAPLTYRVHRRDGSVVLLEVSSVYFEYESKPSVLTMARDITARRHLEMQLAQAERLAALGTLAAGVAHEINNPLAYVMLNLEWVARQLPSLAADTARVDDMMSRLAEARAGAQRVSTIVRELRSFSRADGETRHHVDLAAVVESAIKITAHEIRHRARVSTSFEAVRPVWANGARLEQVVINLLMNAAQAVPEARADENEIRVTIRADADGRAVLEVADNGHGISDEVLPRIFDPFFTTKPIGIGTGLGLSICHGIVTSVGGQISASSGPGAGSSFRVVLPTTASTSQRSAATPDPRPFAVGRRGRVLIVDDEPPIVHTMRELLGLEHEVSTALTAKEALALVRSGADFDVIFCDLMMPGMNGVDLYELLRAERPGIERKIVFMTGGAFTSRAAEFLASVDNRRVDKPFSLGRVEEIARAMIADATDASVER